MSTDRVDSHRPLTGRAERIASERSDAWQVRLFAVVLADELAAAAVTPGASDTARRVTLSEHTLIEWVRGRLQELRRLSANASALVNQVLPVIATAPDSGRDAIAVASVARQLARVHADAVVWTADVRRHSARSAALTEAVTTLAVVSEPLIAGLSRWAAALESGIERHLAHPPGAAANQGASLTLHIDADLAVLRRLEAQLSVLDPTFRILPDQPPLR